MRFCTPCRCDFFDFSICNLLELIGKRAADQAAFLAALSDGPSLFEAPYVGGFIVGP